MKKIVTLCFIYFSISAKSQSFESNLTKFYNSTVTENGLVDYNTIDGRLLNTLVSQIGSRQLNSVKIEDQIAFYINAYNICVIAGVLHRYDEINSVKEDSDFFKTPHNIAGSKIGLDQLEKKILKLYPHGHIHLVLNCGAVGCPPLTKTVYNGTQLEQQLDTVVRKALNHPRVISNGKISSIFRWYQEDFTPNVKDYIKNHGGPDLNNLQYMEYDWTLNQAGVSGILTRYYSSNLYTSGQYEIGVFNNYYSQSNSSNNRLEDYFTSTITVICGLNKRVNLGFDLRVRGVQSGLSDSLNSFGALVFPSETSTFDINGNTIKSSRSGLTAIGLKLKYQPFRKVKNLTFIHTLYIPTIKSGSQFLDWESPYLISDAYYDLNLRAKSALFLSGGLHIENINSTLFGSRPGYSQVSTPITTIYSYFPTKKTTFYGLLNIAPRWGISASNDHNRVISWAPFGQIGAGAKYFLTDNLQFELLYTNFYDTVKHRSANTYNLGVRYYVR